MVRVEDAIVARLEKFGYKFEILVEPNLAMDVKHNKNVSIDSLLAINRVFKDQKTGDEQSPDVLKKVFQTEDIEVIAKKIIQDGEVQLTTEQRRAFLEKKRLEIINFISRNAIDPKTKTPHPPQRIINCIEQAKIHIDPFKSTDEQVRDIVKAIRSLIPISMDKIDFAVKIPTQFAGKAANIIHKYEMKKEEWLNDGSLVAEFSLPVGAKQDLLNELNSATHGEVVLKVIGTVS
ncbi:MAG: ribosome assembly factor SBDS [Candidatus ainarchaeum sp.]|jgi:ribosome maturation protein SDO1|nr:ribosome assembly factor SBDS [Candidatus ainarchaeum sp.]MDD3085560.1 ribosome assembly factor SBDS [Candidatus ainarchaeum sp.]MDD4128752.1 ribosome assembly factor SBDS [Candidatus ainarchaeum sp.]HPM85737.1 ribosome assembly factor SBDS [archaeon]